MHALGGGQLAAGPTLARAPAPRRASPAPRAAASGRAAAAAAAAAPLASRLAELAAAGRLTKSALAALRVAELRDECAALGLDANGPKPALAARLLEWAAAPAAAAAEAAVGASAAPAAPPATPPAAAPAAAEPATGPFSAPGASAPPPPAARAAAPRAPAAAPRAPPPPPAGPLPPPWGVRVTWLGTSSGNPTQRRNVSCIALRLQPPAPARAAAPPPERLVLVDAGEGSRNQLREGGLDPGAVAAIFITHMHGDHCFGLFGVLAAIADARARAAAAAGHPDPAAAAAASDAVRVFGPPEVNRALAAAARGGALRLGVPVLSTSWMFDPARAAAPAPVAGASPLLRLAAAGPDAGTAAAARLGPADLAALQAAFEGGSDRIVRPGLTWTARGLPGGLAATSAQLQHRMPCWGYVFREPPARGTFAERRIADAGAGAASDSEDGSASAASASADLWVRPGRKVVLLGDTCASAAIACAAAGADLLSHEATFNAAMAPKARLATHSTAEQAGAFAAEIGARALVLTHFSARYESGEKYTKAWSSARERGLTVAEMTARVGETLADEARRAARGARLTVQLANDFFTAAVPPRRAAPEAEAAARRAGGASGGESSGDEGERRAFAGAGGGRGGAPGRGRGGGAGRGRGDGGERRGL
jgi:ribonuclease Z